MTATHPGARRAPARTPERALHPRLLALAVHSALLAMLGAPLLAVAQSTGASASSSELSEILVKAKPDDAASKTGTTTVIGAAELERNNATDMANIARYAPLVSVPAAASGSGNIWDGAGNTGFNIRGIEGNRISLEIDGIALPDAAPKPDGTTLNGYGVARDYFDPETFREVRIGAGASPAGAGTPGLGGSVAFVTKSPQDYVSATKQLYGDYKTGYQSANQSRVHALTGAAQIHPDLAAMAVIVHRDGSAADSKGNAVQNPDDWHSDSLLAKLHWKLAPGHQLNFTIDSFDAQHDRVYSNKTGTSYPDGATQDSSTHRDRYSVEYQYRPTGLVLFDSLDAQAYSQNSVVEDRTHANYISAAQPYVRDIYTAFYNHSTGVNLNAVKQIDTNSLLSYGLSYEFQQTRRPWTEDRVVVKTGVHQYTVKTRMADTDTEKLAAYLRGEFGFQLAGQQATFTPGLRAERRELSPQNLQNYIVAVPAAAKEVQKETQSMVTPSLALSVQLTPNFSSYAQYTRGTRMPTAAERTGTYDSFSYTGSGVGYAVLGNPALKKETSNAYELGLKGAPVAGVDLSFALFYTRYNNFIEYAAQPADPVNYPTLTYGLYRPQNLGRARTWGGELSSRLALDQWYQAVPGLSLLVAGGVSRGSAENTLTGNSGALASILPYKASASLAWDDTAKRGGAALSATTVRGKQATEDVVSGTSTARFAIPGYAVYDLSAYWNVNQHVVLSGGVYNLGDKKYWDYASSRSLPAGTTAATIADIERQARPGRNYAVNLKVIY